MKKAAPKSGFFDTLEKRSVRSSGGSFGSGRSSSVGSSRSGFDNSGCGFDGGGSDFRSGFGSGSSGLLFLLTASGQGHGGDQRSQQERLFHACVLKRGVKKAVVLELYSKPETRLAGTRAKDASQLALLHIQPLIIRCIGLFPIGPRWCTASPRLSVVNRHQNQPAKGSERPGRWSIDPQRSRNRACGCRRGPPPCHAR